MKRQQVKHLVTVQEAAEMTSMSIGWWRGALAGRKPMPPVRIIRIGRVVRLHYEDLVAWIDGGTAAPPATRRRGRPTKAEQMARKLDAARQSNEAEEEL